MPCGGSLFSHSNHAHMTSGDLSFSPRIFHFSLIFPTLAFCSLSSNSGSNCCLAPYQTCDPRLSTVRDNDGPTSTFPVSPRMLQRPHNLSAGCTSNARIHGPVIYVGSSPGLLAVSNLQEFAPAAEMLNLCRKK